MLLTRRVRAGILLYALLMSAIFALLLQFYLGRVVAMERQQQAQLAASKAYVMAELVRDMAEQESGQLQFNQGSASYSQKQGQLEVKVALDNGQSFSYRFVKEKSEKKETPEQAKSDQKK